MLKAEMSGSAPNRDHTKSAFEKIADIGDERRHHAGSSAVRLEHAEELCGLRHRCQAYIAPRLNDLEKGLAQGPVISVPTITLEGDANGAPHPEPSSYAKKFSGRYEHRTITGGIGHNLPQEAPQAFAQAVVDVAKG